MSNYTTSQSVRLTRDRFLVSSFSSGGPSQARIKACHRIDRHQVVDEQDGSFRVLYSKDMQGSSTRSFDDFSTSERSSDSKLSEALGDFGDNETNDHKKKKTKKSSRKERVKKGSVDKPSLRLEKEQSTIARSRHQRGDFESSTASESSEQYSRGTYQLLKKGVLLKNQTRETLAEIQFLLASLNSRQGPSTPSRTESLRCPRAA
jgi:hypothetical protein